MTEHAHPDRLAQALTAFIARHSASNAARATHEAAPSRLDVVEREVQEVRTRVNALFFAVITASVADLVARTVLR